MRVLVSLWYSKRHFAACSATSINATIRTPVFSECDISTSHDFKQLVPSFFSEYCQEKYELSVSMDKLKRALTTKCGEECRNLLKFSL